MRRTFTQVIKQNIFRLLVASPLAVSLLIYPLYSQTGGDFTVVVLPDAQNYTKNYPQIFDSQTQWIAKNVATENIKVVVGLGDLVNTASDSTQWANALHSIDILDNARVPYAFPIGNHDYDTIPPTDRKATFFNQYLGPQRYMEKAYYGATNFPSGSNENFYETFTWGGKTYIILVLEYVPRSEAVAWAKSIISSNTDKEVIVITHSYLYSDGTTVDQCDTADMVGDNGGAMLWSNLISQYPNISVVLSGHITNKFTARRSDVGVNGNFVHQLFTNWQDWTNGGNGYLRLMKFSPSNNAITVQSYSPYTRLYLTDPANQFVLKWHNDGTSGNGVAGIAGRVRTSANGAKCRAIAGATINIGGTTATSDINGYYTLSQAPGQYSATASALGYKSGTQASRLNDYFPNELDFFLTAAPLCALNSTDPSVTICTPAPNATFQSPINIIAGTHDSTAAVTNTFIWVDGVKKWSGLGAAVNTSLPMPLGRHRITVQAKDSTGRYFQATVYINVVSPTPAVIISAPAPNSTVHSPVNIVASAQDPGATVSRMFTWVDGVKRWTSSGATLNTSLTMANGRRRVTVQAKDSVGHYFQSTVYVTVQ
jgi:hypothetical protein